MTEARTWRLDLPILKPLLMNNRLHYRARAEQNATIRDLAKMHARMAAVPHLDRCQVVMHYVPRDKRRRDEDNLVATLKPLCDGLVLAGVVDDDTPDLMVKLMPVIDPPNSATTRSRVYLVITELDALAVA